MKYTLSKVKDNFDKFGFFNTVIKVILYPINLFKNKNFRTKILHLNSNEDRFTWIYQVNYWSNAESRSGSGSTLEYTKNLRLELPIVFNKFSIKNIFDAPCGDFNWMCHLLQTVEINYIGGDIVKPLIINLKKKYSTNCITFIHFDLTKEVPPKVDLMICRDCLFHLSYEDTRAVLENFIKSDSNFLLTTTHKNSRNLFVNKNISTGDFRLIDLFSAPYNFPSDPLYIIEDWLAPDPERFMCLWTKTQVLSALNYSKNLS